MTVQMVSNLSLLPRFMNLRVFEQNIGKDYNREQEGVLGSTERPLSEAGLLENASNLFSYRVVSTRGNQDKPTITVLSQ